MEINSCLACLEVLNNENSASQQEFDSMEVSLFEDLHKQKIVTKLCETEESVILCKSCKYLFEVTLEKQISDAEEFNKTLDQSIQNAKFLIGDLQALKIEDLDALERENLGLDKEGLVLDAQILRYNQEIAELEKSIVELNKMQIEAIYNMIGRADTFLELETRGKVLQDEAEFLNSKHLILRVFQIDISEKVGSINGMRMGWAENVIISWDEINAAWGQCTFLVYSLFQINGFKSKVINLYPLGAHSRISNKKDDDERFELFFSDYNYTNLIARFNKAQNLFLEIVKEYEELFRDSGAPYSLEKGFIGGLPIIFDPKSKDRWSQALKFLLQDLNYFLHKVL